MDLSSIRIREHFGLVTNDTHTGQFSFLVSPPTNRTSVEKQDYVLVNHPLLGESCQIVAVIKEITSYEEVSGSTIMEKIGKMLATTEIIGFVDLKNENKPLQRLLAPPNPGTRVYVPLAKFLEDIFNRNAEGEAFKTPIQIGMFEASSAEQPENNGRIKCYIDAQELITKPTIITAVAGAGKTHIAKILIQELTEKTSTPIIILDSYGEYVTGLVANSKIILSDSKTEKENIANQIKEKQNTILNGQSLTSEEKREFFTNNLRKLLNLRLEEKVKPFFLLIEEAETLKGETLDQVITQGRKVGISTCLLTVYPTELGGKILSQMGNQIVGKTTDRDDIEELTNITNMANASLPELAVGEWIINGVNRSRPMKLQAKE